MLIPLTFIAAAVETQAVPPAAPPQGSNPIEVLGPRRFYGPPFLSPMGEPFRQRVPHDDPLADWFHQADRNHDGYLTADEMVLDADRFFAVLDLDHNGVIDPEEIENYEQVIAPEVRGEPLELRQQPKPSDDEGVMACSTCHVIVDAADFEDLPRASEEEEDLLDLAAHATRTSRLACQIVLTKDMKSLTVRVPPGAKNWMGR
jgi:ferredoxin